MSRTHDVKKSLTLPAGKLKKLSSLTAKQKAAEDLVSYYKCCLAIRDLIEKLRCSTEQISLALKIAKRKVDYWIEIAGNFTETEVILLQERRNAKKQPLSRTHLRILAKVDKPIRRQLLMEWKKRSLNSRELDFCRQTLQRHQIRGRVKTIKKHTFSTKELTGLTAKLKSLKRTLDALSVADITALLARRKDELQTTHQHLRTVKEKIASCERRLRKQI